MGCDRWSEMRIANGYLICRLVFLHIFMRFWMFFGDFEFFPSERVLRFEF